MQALGIRSLAATVQNSANCDRWVLFCKRHSFRRFRRGGGVWSQFSCMSCLYCVAFAFRSIDGVIDARNGSEG